MGRMNTPSPSEEARGAKFVGSQEISRGGEAEPDPQKRVEVVEVALESSISKEETAVGVGQLCSVLGPHLPSLWQAAFTPCKEGGV